MEQVARDLGAWMELAPGTRQEIVDVSDLVTRFRLAVADELDAQDEHARQIQGAASAIELVSNLTRRYDNAIGWLADARIPHHPLHSCKKNTMIFLQEGRILHGDC